MHDDADNYSGELCNTRRLYLKSHLAQIRSSWYWILTREKLQPHGLTTAEINCTRLIGKTKNDGTSCVNTVVGCCAATGYLSCNGARDISVALLNCFVFAWRCQAELKIQRRELGARLKRGTERGGEGETKGRNETRNKRMSFNLAIRPDSSLYPPAPLLPRRIYPKPRGQLRLFSLVLAKARRLYSFRIDADRVFYVSNSTGL